VIIWLNGPFAAGKTTLAEELRQRLPEAVVYNPDGGHGKLPVGGR
jgi:adenylylsulfate kinase-like enzyme